ncbi:MAG: hypothetical protein JO264_10065 [Acidisphaera sp.]|nr:hypothetical protein [Acidisphaera sp.]
MKAGITNASPDPVGPAPLRVAPAVLAALLTGLLPAMAQESPLHKVGDDRIRQTMIRESIARVRGACACPWQLDRHGHPCDGHSAYAPSHPGTPPFCYATDITDGMVQEWRRVHHRYPPIP